MGGDSVDVDLNRRNVVNLETTTEIMEKEDETVVRYQTEKLEKNMITTSIIVDFFDMDCVGWSSSICIFVF